LTKLDAVSCPARQFKLENVSKTGSVQWKNLTVFLAISRGVNGYMQDYLDYLPYSCFVTEFGQNTRRLDQIFTFKIKTLPTATKIPKSTKVIVISTYLYHKTRKCHFASASTVCGAEASAEGHKCEHLQNIF
jgi:hypothetical protein